MTGRCHAVFFSARRRSSQVRAMVDAAAAVLSDPALDASAGPALSASAALAGAGSSGVVLSGAGPSGEGPSGVGTVCAATTPSLVVLTQKAVSPVGPERPPSLLLLLSPPPSPPAPALAPYKFPYRIATHPSDPVRGVGSPTRLERSRLGGCCADGLLRRRLLRCRVAAPPAAALPGCCAAGCCAAGAPKHVNPGQRRTTITSPTSTATTSPAASMIAVVRTGAPTIAHTATPIESSPATARTGDPERSVAGTAGDVLAAGSGATP